MRLTQKFQWFAAFAMVFCSTMIAGAQQHGTTGPSLNQDMIKFISPAPGEQTKDGTATVSLRFEGTADPTTLKILANGKDVTNQFSLASCAATPCTISATLNVTNSVVGGWNYLTATVTGAGGAAGSARARFFSTTGQTIADRLANSASKSSAGPMNVPIFPYNYYPPFLVHMYTDQSGKICVASYCESTPYIWLMDRSTLTVTQTGVDPSILPTLDSNTIVIVNVPGTAAKTMDFSSVGGTNFTTQNAPTPYGYTMVSYGGAQPGTAYECYNGISNTPWHGIEGNLVNYGRNTPLYSFVPDESPGFVVQPGTAKSYVTVGNVQNFKLGSVAPPNRVLPPFGIGSTKYASPDLGEAAGGFWVLVLDPFLLQQVSSTFYGTNCPSCTSTSSAAQVQLMAADLTNITNGSWIPPEDQPVVFITTVGVPFNNATVETDFQGSPAFQIVDAIWNLGVSSYAFNDLTSASSPSFSMVGIPGRNVRGGGTSYDQYSAPTNPDAAKWFSTTVDGDTGALKGVLKRNNQFLYNPASVGDFDASTLPTNPTADDLLEFSIIDQLGSSMPVTWPIENGAAYQYLSAQIISQDFYGGAGCGAPAQVCNDIHFYYTGDQIDGITSGVDPRTIPYPGDGNGFSQQDLSAVASQLNYEKTYLRNVRNYERWLEDVETNGEVNIGTALTSAATEVANQLNQVTGLEKTHIPETKMHLATDIINDTASVVGIFGPADPAVGAVSSVLRLSANLITTISDAEGTTLKPDPYVNQLGDLLGTQAGQAASSAVKFNSDMQVSTGTFFNSIYSDWFRLQTLGLLTVNPDNTDWYIANSGTSSGSLSPVLISGARRSFYVQALPQYFEIAMISHMPQRSMLKTGYTQKAVDDFASDILTGNPPSQPGFLDTGQYSWDNRNTPGMAGCQDYIFVVLSSSVSVSSTGSTFTGATNWGDFVGPTVMGPATGSDGLGPLNLNRNFIYDSRILDTVFWAFGWGTDLTPALCASGSSDSGGGVTDSRILTTTELAAASATIATGDQVSLHIKVHSVGSSDTDTPTGLVHLKLGNTIIGTLGLGHKTESDYLLDSSRLSPGDNQITANYQGDANHLGSISTPVTLTVGDSSFVIAPAKNSLQLSRTPGSQASVDLTLSTQFGFNGPVQFSCSNVPQYLLCSFSNPQLTAQNSPQTTTVVFTMIGTLQSSNQHSIPNGSGHGNFELAGLVGLVGMALFGSKSRRTFLPMLILIIGLGISGCGGSSSPTTKPVNPVTKTVTINATGAGITRSQQIQLTIQ